MSELDREPDINELTDLAYRIAQSEGIVITPAKIAEALVVHRFGGVKKTRERIGKQVLWTPESYADAGKLANLIQRSLRGEAIEPPMNGSRFERSEDESWQQLAENLDEAFSFDEGSADTWLSGNDPDKFKEIQDKLREAVGIDAINTTGLLMVSSDEGGVGLGLMQAKIMGLGLGYVLTEDKGSLSRRDVGDSLSFDQYLMNMREHQKDPTKFSTQYYIALQKLCAFGEHYIKEGNSTLE